MDLEAVRAFLSENAGKADVKAFVEGLNPITTDKVKNFVNTDTEAKNWLQSQKDSHFDKSIETWKKNNLEPLVMDKVKELYPEETEDQKRIRLLEAKLEEANNKEARELLKSKAIEMATGKNLPANLVDYFLGKDEEETAANLAKLEGTFNPFIETRVNAEVDKRFNDSSYKFNQGSDGKTSIGESIAKELNKQPNPAAPKAADPWGGQ